MDLDGLWVLVLVIGFCFGVLCGVVESEVVGGKFWWDLDNVKPARETERKVGFYRFS